MKRPSILARLRYAFDNTLSQGPLALIGWLALAASAMVILPTLAVLALRASPAGLGALGVFWDILSQALTPNPVDAHNPWQFLAIMLVVTLGSLFMVSVLIGVLTGSIEQRVEALQRGRSRVIEDGHIIILGRSEQVFAVIAELVVANAHRRGEVAFGYRVRALASDPDRAHGVIVNPDKSLLITFAPGDRAIVLAES